MNSKLVCEAVKLCGGIYRLIKPFFLLLGRFKIFQDIMINNESNTRLALAHR